MKELIIILLIIHGLIHLLGFSKANGMREWDQFSHNISKPEGMIWLSTAFLFLISATFFLMDFPGWLITAILSVILSQILIVKHWFDTRMGTIVNVIIILAILINFNVK